jgi:hypothetical protein
MKEPFQANKEQLEFPFPVYAEREDLLKQLKFSRGIGANAGSLYAVLYEIAKFPESWQTQATIATNTKLSRPTVQRAIKVLGKCDLITTERKWFAPAKQHRNFHRCNWTEVRRRAEASKVDRPMHQFEASRDRPKHQFDADRSINSNIPKHQFDADQCINLMHKQQVLVESELQPTTEPEVVVGCGENAFEETAWTPKEVQHICDRLLSLNCKGDVLKAVDAARRRGWTFAKALQVIEQSDPDRPSWLFNWFFKDGSWERHLATKEDNAKSSQSHERNHPRGADAMTRHERNAFLRETAVTRELHAKYLAEEGRLATDAEVQQALEALERGCA